ncbi:DUF2778 domain-containing protein [Marinomonas rhizomae]|uniref:tlde1 domain-containing protein n=1 Tax=Marinomonas rhizomae TaxID=491948 RepID=UPI002101D994|nr:tlde1 domain-containing protein [Marinomonas rhizomae]UTV99850.1 DUF2778 domain-containing protein [Marinomonas rhizomae]
MLEDMLYNGTSIEWGKHGSFKATSGLPDHQVPDQSCTPDSGPIPEGYYKIFISDHGVATDKGLGRCALRPSWGIQEIPRGELAGLCEPYWENWGNNRARMEPADQATKDRCLPTKRGGFYIHDSTKGYSHGCIEVETKIFPLLKHVNSTRSKKVLIIKVAYKGVSTNGGTKV